MCVTHDFAQHRLWKPPTKSSWCLEMFALNTKLYLETKIDELWASFETSGTRRADFQHTRFLLVVWIFSFLLIAVCRLMFVHRFCKNKGFKFCVFHFWLVSWYTVWRVSCTCVCVYSTACGQTFSACAKFISNFFSGTLFMDRTNQQHFACICLFCELFIAPESAFCDLRAMSRAAPASVPNLNAEQPVGCFFVCWLV